MVNTVYTKAMGQRSSDNLLCVLSQLYYLTVIPLFVLRVQVSFSYIVHKTVSLPQ